MKSQRVKINKADGDSGDGTIFRLTEIEPQFVSLVTAGANRQKKFQVVKADDGETSGAQTGKGAGDTSSASGDNELQSGTDSDPTGLGSDGDFAAWLDEAESQVGKSLEDAQIELLLTSDVPAASSPPDDSTQQRVGKSDAQVTKAFEGLQAEFAQEIAKNKELATRVDKLTGTIAKLKKQVASLTTERDKYRAKVVRLKSNVGGVTSIQTGVVSKGSSRKPEADPRDGAWASGGDLASRIED